MSKAVLWDFDGTLAERPGLWSQAMVEVLDVHEPGHGYRRDDLRPALRDGFPWHRPDEGHPHLSDSATWWGSVAEVLAGAYRSVGYPDARAMELAKEVRACFLDPTCWRVFDDTVPTLTALGDRGWRHVVVSNHVPELEHLVADLGLARHLDAVVTSAQVGFEKPHPAIFDHALAVVGHPEVVWMVGDNATADVGGAEALGIPAILVRREGGAERCAPGLVEAARLILDADG